MMKTVDYIIVGCGLAGIAFCEQLRKNNKSFIVYDDNSQQSSKVAGGLLNPVVLKRFTAAWKARELYDYAFEYYRNLEQYLDHDLIKQTPVFRIFGSIEEQNNWFTASDKPFLSEFLSPELVKSKNEHIKAEFGFGKVRKVGRIDTETLIKTYVSILSGNSQFMQEHFSYDALNVDKEYIIYSNFKAKQLVFADGFGLKNNPFFNYLPLLGSKGEYLVIKSSGLDMEAILKGAIFIIPLGDNKYLVGATYNNKDKTSKPTTEARQELIKKLKNIISCDFEVVGQRVGIRPTVRDRRPLVGTHPTYKQIAVINGLGTRGVMASPYLAHQLYNAIENGDSLDSEIDIKRFQHLFLG